MQLHLHLFTIQNVSIKLKLTKTELRKGIRFTIQNVSIKSETAHIQNQATLNLQYKMFLLNEHIIQV